METNLITLSNDLITASYTLSLPERRLIYLFLAVLDNRINYVRVIGKEELTLADNLTPIDPNKYYTLSVSLYAEFWKLSNFEARREIKQVAEALFNRVATLQIGGREYRTRWITADNLYNETKDELQLCWAPKIIPYISELRANFTSIRMRWIRELSTGYSMRIYEYLSMLLSRCRKKSLITSIILEDLKVMLELRDKYQKTNHLLTRVLWPAIEEISKRTNIKITCVDNTGKYMYVKEGKSIVGVKLGIEWKVLKV